MPLYQNIYNRISSNLATYLARYPSQPIQPVAALRSAVGPWSGSNQWGRSGHARVLAGAPADSTDIIEASVLRLPEYGEPRCMNITLTAEIYEVSTRTYGSIIDG